ncbi:YraN family protein [Brucella oryzae]|uniref:YraN family protein n=1 Tax=Brucella oryzae TaxID=335286 RepID=UPI001B837097|nr:YraN family protein [Brucella oryzae]MBR7650747.1 YraN family protein [Brucella oryzae]
MTELREKKRIAFFRGHSAERFAAMVLLLKGFRIVARRYRTRLGEIDLIARRGNLVLIVEVKARSSLEAAHLAVTPQAMRRIEAAADLWLQRQPDHARLSLRFDLIAVLPRRWPKHVPAFFTSGDYR